MQYAVCSNINSPSLTVTVIERPCLILLEQIICSCPITAEYDDVAPRMMAEFCPAVTKQPLPLPPFPLMMHRSVLLLAGMGIQWSRTDLIVEAVIRSSRVGGTKTSTCTLALHHSSQSTNTVNDGGPSSLRAAPMKQE